MSRYQSLVLNQPVALNRGMLRIDVVRLLVGPTVCRSSIPAWLMGGPRRDGTCGYPISASGSRGSVCGTNGLAPGWKSNNVLTDRTARLMRCIRYVHIPKPKDTVEYRAAAHGVPQSK
jgi:hypothetical protein